MNKKTYKVVDLFGKEEFRFYESTKRKIDLFNDYEGFVDKFKPKKTTDDCYTPPEVYQIVLDYVKSHCNLEEKEIIRPFYPGGDYEDIEYPDNAVVIDNPPFSIITKICKFYIDRNIPFFLFAPHLTLFSSDVDVTHIVVNATITYENGATVKTSFLSNMFGDVKIIGDAQLLEKFNQLNARKKVNKPKYDYPNEVITVFHVSWIISRGISIKINKKDAKHCRALESQKKHKKAIFGSGFLLSEKAAAEKAAAEKDDVIIWDLSESERTIIQSLG
ncbi:chromosome partitioning protein ParB [Weeksella virosa]|nr:chromosome partitioning protein ParB [Weeksella virosa]